MAYMKVIHKPLLRVWIYPCRGNGDPSKAHSIRERSFYQCWWNSNNLSGADFLILKWANLSLWSPCIYQEYREDRAGSGPHAASQLKKGPGNVNQAPVKSSTGCSCSFAVAVLCTAVNTTSRAEHDAGPYRASKKKGKLFWYYLFSPMEMQDAFYELDTYAKLWWAFCPS